MQNNYLEQIYNIFNVKGAFELPKNMLEIVQIAENEYNIEQKIAIIKDIKNLFFDIDSICYDLLGEHLKIDADSNNKKYDLDYLDNFFHIFYEKYKEFATTSTLYHGKPYHMDSLNKFYCWMWAYASIFSNDSAINDLFTTTIRFIFKEFIETVKNSDEYKTMPIIFSDEHESIHGISLSMIAFMTNEQTLAYLQYIKENLEERIIEYLNKRDDDYSNERGLTDGGGSGYISQQPHTSKSVNLDWLKKTQLLNKSYNESALLLSCPTKFELEFISADKHTMKISGMAKITLKRDKASVKIDKIIYDGEDFKEYIKINSKYNPIVNNIANKVKEYFVQAVKNK